MTRTMEQWVCRIPAAGLFGVLAFTLSGCAATPSALGDQPGMRYYGGPKQPMYPEQSLYPRQPLSPE